MNYEKEWKALKAFVEHTLEVNKVSSLEDLPLSMISRQELTDEVERRGLVRGFSVMLGEMDFADGTKREKER